MDSLWQLWGTFSVADHLRPHAFVSDVLVYDRLLLPVPPPNNLGRWNSLNWEPQLQRNIIDILRDGDANRVLEISWDDRQQQEYTERRDVLSSNIAFDTRNLLKDKRANPDSLPQLVTRLVLANASSEEKDRELLRAAMPGLPPAEISVVAAYGTLTDFAAQTGVVEQPLHDAGSLARDDLLGGFLWPFAVPADSDRSDEYLLNRAVEFANTPEVKSYREAFHLWRYNMITLGKDPVAAAIDLQEQIGLYEEWVQNNKRNTVIQGACIVGAVATGVAAAILPVVGLPIVAAYVGSGGAIVPTMGVISTRLFRGRMKRGFDPNISPGALFWEAQRAILQ